MGPTRGPRRNMQHSSHLLQANTTCCCAAHPAHTSHTAQLPAADQLTAHCSRAPRPPFPRQSSSCRVRLTGHLGVRPPAAISARARPLFGRSGPCVHVLVSLRVSRALRSRRSAADDANCRRGCPRVLRLYTPARQNWVPESALISRQNRPIRCIQSARTCAFFSILGVAGSV